jgi:hypothetical protein
MTRRVCVYGAGVTGLRVVNALVAHEPPLEIDVVDIRRGAASRLAGRHTGRVRAVLDAAAGTDVAVIATPRPQAPLVERLLRAGTAVVSPCDDRGDVEAMLALADLAASRNVPLVIGAAASPGLSGLLARHLSSRLDRTDEIHVAVHGTGGPACAHQHHRALKGTAYGWYEGAWLERPAGTGRELCWFPEPIGPRDCYRADLVDPTLLVLAFPGVRRVSARRSANRRDRLTARLPMMRPPHPEGGLGGVRVEVRGAQGDERITLVAGVSERTGAIAAHVATRFALMAAASELDRGLVLPGSADLDTNRILLELGSAGLRFNEFVGTEVAV